MVEVLQCLCVALALACAAYTQEAPFEIRQLDESAEKENLAFVTKTKKEGKSVRHVNEP